MMREEETWLGVGPKVGGMLLPVGFESVFGTSWNLKNPNDKHEFTIKSSRLGLGLGGGGEMTFLAIFKAKSIYQVNGMRMEDWGINVDITKGRLKDVKNLIKLKKSIDTLRLVTNVYNIVGNLNDIRETMSFFYDMYDADSSPGPTVQTLDIPFSGAGLEVSAFKTIGTLQIDYLPIPTLGKGIGRGVGKGIGRGPGRI